MNGGEVPRPIHISDLNPGDTVFEDTGRGSVEVRVSEDVKRKLGQWSFTGETPNGPIDFLVTDGVEAYGPIFYKEPFTVPVYRIEAGGERA